MTILDLIKAACKTKGVPEKYAERIQKTFNIVKAEGLEASVDLFRDNILPAIQEAETEARTQAETAAVAAYETKYNIKDGKPVEEKPKPEAPIVPPVNEPGVSPELKKVLEAMQKTVDELNKKVDDNIRSSEDEAKLVVARQQIKAANLPESWLSRVDVSSKVSLEDQVNALSKEYTEIQQSAINNAVERGDYQPGNMNVPERSVEDWAKIMNGEDTKSANTGVVDLGLDSNN